MSGAGEFNTFTWHETEAAMCMWEWCCSTRHFVSNPWDEFHLDMRELRHAVLKAAPKMVETWGYFANKPLYDFETQFVPYVMSLATWGIEDGKLVVILPPLVMPRAVAKLDPSYNTGEIQ